MPGMFDDLIPVPAVAAPPGNAASPGMFDDLVPVAKPKPKEDITAGMALSGIPILGAYIPQAEAALQAAVNPLTGVGEGGGSFSERYAKNLPMRQGLYKEAEEQQPALATAAKMIGGTAATGGLGATATGARLLGLAGTTLPRMVGQGALSGGAINAADAAARGENPVMAGGLGALVGGGAPVAGRVISSVAQPVVRAWRGIADPAAEASRRVAAATQRDIAAGGAGLTDAEFQAARAAGTPVNLMDVGGETTRALARSAANTSPEGRAILSRSIDDRFENQSPRITNWLNRTFHYPDAEAQQRAILQAAQSANRPAYRRAIQDSHAQNVVLWDADLEQLAQAPEVQNAIRLATPQLRNWAVRDGLRPPVGAFEINNGRTTLRQTANGNTYLPGLQYWDYVKRALDEMNTPTSRAFSRSLRDKLDSMVPAYRDARAGAATFFRAGDALEAGQNFVTQNFGNNQARQALAQMSAQERQLFQDGFVSRFIETMNNAGDRRNVLNFINHSPAHREKLNIALGPQRARELESLLRVEGVMDMARGAVQGNSTTARQLSELGLAGGADWLSGGGSFSTDPAALMNAALMYGAARGRRVIDHRVARQVAELLTSNDPRRLNVGMQLLSHQSGLLDAIRHGDAALAAIFARGSLPAVTSALTH